MITDITDMTDMTDQLHERVRVRVRVSDQRKDTITIITLIMIDDYQICIRVIILSI